MNETIPMVLDIRPLLQRGQEPISESMQAGWPWRLDPEKENDERQPIHNRVGLRRQAVARRRLGHG